MSEYRCRLMQEAELDKVIELVQQAGKFAWTPQNIQQSFVSTHASSYVFCSVEKQKLLGYAVIHKVLDESHLLNIVIKKQEQAKGLGTAFLQQLISMLKQENLKSLMLEVRASNLAAIRLYEQLGFQRDGHRSAYYPSSNGREDAWLYSLSLR